MPKEGKKKFSTLHVQKKIMHLLKSALLYIHPHRPPPSPITILMVHPLDGRGRVLSNYFHLSLHLI